MIDDLNKAQNKRGYLKENYLIFHLKDCKDEQFDYHYHEFYKIIFFISGNVTYLIEGETYILSPWDVLLISNKDIHRAVINNSEAYERFVIWIKPEYLVNISDADCNLLSCFGTSAIDRQNLLRLSPCDIDIVKKILFNLELSIKNSEFGSTIESNSLFTLLVLYLNRFVLRSRPVSLQKHSMNDNTIFKIVKYINDNIGSDLTIDRLAKDFYISKYTLMHNFKKQTGFTIHHFILQKRLILAGMRIKEGIPVMDVSLECGFSDYSSFLRAFKKFYGVLPRQYK